MRVRATDTVTATLILVGGLLALNGLFGENDPSWSIIGASGCWVGALSADWVAETLYWRKQWERQKRNRRGPGPTW